MSNTNTSEQIDTAPNYARRRAVAGTIAGILLSPLLVKGFMDSHNQYGYDPSKNPAPLTYLETHQGINPANIISSKISEK